MAVIWQERIKDTNYEVRSAGNTVRLYTDGVFHSQYNPKQKVTKNVWDLLFLPALFYPQGAIKRVLILGVGGGVAIHQLNDFVSPLAITGVELNPTHIKVAKRFFGVNYKNTKLVKADAIKWVEEYDGAPFDMIIDDIYGEEEGEPKRPIEADSRWFNKLLPLLSDKGLLVTNFVTPKEFKTCGYFSNKTVRNKFVNTYKFTTQLYENQIGAFFRSDESLKHFRSNLNLFRELRTEAFSKSFRVRKVK